MSKELREKGRIVQEAIRAGKSVLLIGPPGAGKTMIARRLKPKLSKRALNESARIYRIAGLVQTTSLATPFRAPHHTASVAGMLGSGTQARPGELSLAHGGVLFLDELPEFSRWVLESVAHAFRDKRVTFDAPKTWLKFLPADFVLVGATNPCPCGGAKGTWKCSCTEAQIERYHARYDALRFDVTVKL